MASRRLDLFIGHLRKTLRGSGHGPSTDAQLLTRYVVARDEAAFEGLVSRHGPMVFAVCRRLLTNHADAEDAFQATFLILVRKAAAISCRETVGNWLYGVAYRTALEARTVKNRRCKKEQQLKDLPDRQIPADEPCRESREVLDHALSRLPAKYRLPIVLCELEGCPRREVAQQLGVPEGTLSSRLATGRKLLAKRLSRHGPQIAGAAVAAALANGASAVPPPMLVKTTVRAAMVIITGNSASVEAVSASVAALVKGTVNAMWLSKLKFACVALLTAAAIAGIGTGSFCYRAGAEDEQPAPQLPSAGETTRLQAKLAAAEAEAKAAEARAKTADEEARAARTAAQRLTMQLAPQLNKAATDSLARRFLYRVPITLGFSEFKNGARLEILEVWGTQPEIKIGGQYLVRGKYKLPTQDGTLYFYQTATGPEASDKMDLQRTNVSKGEGEFTLFRGMEGPGYFHLVLTDGAKDLANLYFGTGENVLRQKTW